MRSLDLRDLTQLEDGGPKAGFLHWSDEDLQLCERLDAVDCRNVAVKLRLWNGLEPNLAIGRTVIYRTVVLLLRLDHSEAPTRTTMAGLWELPQWDPKKRLGLVREMPPNLRLIRRELLTTQIPRMHLMILVLAEARGDSAEFHS